MGDEHGLNESAAVCSTSEQVNVAPGLVSVNVKVGVLRLVSVVGLPVIVTLPIWYFCEATAPALPAASFAKYCSVALLATLMVTGDGPLVLVAVGVVPSVV